MKNMCKKNHNKNRSSNHLNQLADPRNNNSQNPKLKNQKKLFRRKRRFRNLAILKRPRFLKLRKCLRCHWTTSRRRRNLQSQHSRLGCLRPLQKVMTTSPKWWEVRKSPSKKMPKRRPRKLKEGKTAVLQLKVVEEDKAHKSLNFSHRKAVWMPSTIEW